MTLCRKLKDDPRTAHMPVVLLTARSSQQCRLEGMARGAGDYLTKPFDAAERVMRVKNLILQRQQLKRQFGLESLLNVDVSTLGETDRQFLALAVQTIQAHF